MGAGIVFGDISDGIEEEVLRDMAGMPKKWDIKSFYGHRNECLGGPLLCVELHVVEDGVPLTVFARADVPCEHLKEHIVLSARKFKQKHLDRMKWERECTTS